MGTRHSCVYAVPPTTSDLAPYAVLRPSCLPSPFWTVKRKQAKAYCGWAPPEAWMEWMPCCQWMDLRWRDVRLQGVSVRYPEISLDGDMGGECWRRDKRDKADRRLGSTAYHIRSLEDHPTIVTRVDQAQEPAFTRSSSVLFTLLRYSR